MVKIKVLNEEILEEVLDIEKVVGKVEEVYSFKEKNEAKVFPMIFHEFEPGKADMDIKSGHLMESNIFGLKLVSWFAENKKKGLPELFGSIMIFDDDTGKPQGLLNGDYITGVRTGAAGGVGSKYLARDNSEVMLMVGAGHTAYFHVLANLITMDNLNTIIVYDPISFQNAKEFCNKLKSLNNNLYNNLYNKVDFKVKDNIKDAVKEADIITTATPSREPLIKKDWIKPGTHINCFGSDMEGKQEIDENIFSEARVFVDDIEQAVNVGETENPIKKNIFKKENIIGEIGAVIENNVQGRNDESNITIFDSTGLALQDLTTADLALKLAKEKSLGTEVEL